MPPFLKGPTISLVTMHTFGRDAPAILGIASGNCLYICMSPASRSGRG